LPRQCACYVVHSFRAIVPFFLNNIRGTCHCLLDLGMGLRRGICM
jgi:hypothetical protein